MNASGPAATRTVILWAVALLALMPWIVVQAQAVFPGNVSWLLIAAERLLSGISLSEGAYETNPPLSILIYAPHVLIARITSLPLPYGAAIFTFSAIALSAFAVNALITRIPGLSDYEKTAAVFGHLAGITVISTVASFGDREHLIMMALIPFVLSQHLIGRKIRIEKALLYPVLLFGTLAVLVKPHYGLLPALFLLFRMIGQRRPGVVFDADFLFLATGTLCYAAAIFLFFPDYVPVILPDALDLYVAVSDVPTTMRMIRPHLIAYVSLLVIELVMEDLDARKKRLILFLYTCALLALIPMLVQMKGYYNHLIPAYGFFVTALSLSVFCRAEKYMSRHKFTALLIPLLILGVAQLAVPVGREFPKHADITRMPVARFLQENCAQPCAFLAIHENIEIVLPTAVYMNYTYASRFPTFWFLPRMLVRINTLQEEEKSGPESEKLAALHEKYALLVAEDLARYKPSLLMIGNNITVSRKKNFDFLGFFSENAAFRTLLQENYEKTGTYAFNRGDYFQGTTLRGEFILRYDIYKRKDAPWTDTPSFTKDENP